ncbi:MAG: CTP synthase C-terminal region-related (seleno)protein [Gemmatimonadaceae bacterium]
MIRLAVIGDFDRGVTAHLGIDATLQQAQQSVWPDLSWEWWHTSTLPDRAGDFVQAIGVPDGVWCTPASPYAKTQGALAAIRYARESDTPFLGTCGGFQHAVLEFVHNVLGESDAQHAELHPAAAMLAITPLACELVEVTEAIECVPGTRLAGLYPNGKGREAYHCRFGMNPSYAARLESRGLRCAARDPSGEVRALEHTAHSFFVGVLFQPERRGLAGDIHPLVTSFVEAARARRTKRGAA